jgi:hypothetical protein
MGDGVRQLGEFLAGRCLDPTKPGGSIEVIHIHAIEEKHVKVDVEQQPI